MYLVPGIAANSSDEFQIKHCYLMGAVHRETEFHMKNYNVQAHSCGIYEKAYVFALQRITLFSHFIISVEDHFSLFSRDDSSKAPSLAIPVHWHSMWVAYPQPLSSSDGFSSLAVLPFSFWGGL